ncbi:TlyA family RNA methyltransferase [uncultured Propionibacterium sp.]|uniref:TlyA family RNA methyltransferase n=1 Tax=uncultured Propionibacterium sp. TaxID=218066 RepID=UPI0029309913|nr:TlyA family RNA methyltransferase [uncultured Propionibacterium sp.]
MTRTPDQGRLDQELPARGLARSRSQASELIRSGRVRIGGAVVTKASTSVGPGDEIRVEADPWVSRAAHKLLSALDESGVEVPARVLDAGASTGGFTQVLLSRGARQVYAVDVGHGQLAPLLRADPRVRCLEGVNLRELAIGHVDDRPVDLAVGDVSFISLRLVMAPILGVLAPGAMALLLVKPQFEVGRQRLGAGGVVTREPDREWAVHQVLDEAGRLGWNCFWQAPSRLPGSAGNLEFFIGLRRAGDRTDPAGRGR